jgi:uncharacterized protein YebE (UPF0316 family)
MNITSVVTPEMYTWVILPLLIFSARVVDVSLDTIRILFISKRLKYLAPVIGFFEVLIWLMAMRQIMQDLNNIAYMIAYAAGFATGNFVGMYIEQLLSIGKVIIRIISRDCDGLVDSLRTSGCGVTSIEARGLNGPVKIIFSIINRADVAKVVAKIREFNPQAFYSLEDVSSAREEVSYGDITLKRKRLMDYLLPKKKAQPIAVPCVVQEESIAGSTGS